MRRFFWGLIFLILWDTVCIYWFVCGIRNLCEQPKPAQVVVAVTLPPPAPEPKPEPKPEPAPAPAPEPTPPPKPEPEKQLVLPDIYFIFDRDIVKNMEELTAVTKQVIEYMSDHPESKVYITGHTCNMGEPDHNYDLGMLRAYTVKQYMISMGVAEDRFFLESKGPDEPKAQNDTREDKMENRRVHITVK